MTNGTHEKRPPAGGLGGPYAPTDRRTKTLLCRAVRWPTTPEQRAKVLARLSDALKYSKTPREIASVAKAIAAIESQNQADDHLLDKNARLDSGQATDRQEHRMLNLEFGD